MPFPLLSAADAVLVAPDQIGGKAAGLAWLDRQGFSVPSWFVVPTDTVQALLDGAGLPGEGSSREWRQVVEALEPPPAFEEALRKALAALSGGPEGAVAVRSSAVGEDGADASFAGQLDSFFVPSEAGAVARAVLRCVASAWSDRAVAYRRQHGLAGEAARVAVVVQRVVEGEASGVLFTAHPVTGSRRHALVSAAHGCGEGVVSGRVEADEWTAPLDGSGRVEATVRQQAEAARIDPVTQAVCYEALAQEQGQAAALDDGAVRELVQMGERAARAAGRPLDLEWTRAAGRFWLLQARPITALPPPQDGVGLRTVWDNSNIQESYCGVTTPLTFSFARRAYATVYRETMRAVGLSERVVAAHEPVLDALLGLHRGRVFYNITHWYRGLLLLPAFRRNKADMERMMGLQQPVDFVEDEAPSRLERLQRVPGLARTLVRLLARFARIDRDVADFHRAFQRAARRVDRDALHLRTAAELVDLARELRRRVLERWTAPIVNDFFVMMMGGRVRRALERAGVEQPDLVVSGLLAGLDDLESLQPTCRLLALAHTIRADADLTALVDALPDGRLPDAVQARHPLFWTACVAYLDDYGDRCPGELKLETVTPREDPSRLFALLRGLLARPDLDAGTLRTSGRTLRLDTEQAVERQIRASAGLAGALRVRRFRADLGRFRRGIRHRESTRMERTRLFGLFRSVYLELGRHLALTGALAAPRDVLYLTVDEIDALRDAAAVQADLRPLVAARRAEFARYEADDVPHHFSTWDLAALSPLYPPPHATPAGADERRLSGTGCFPGVVEGEVAAVTDPEHPPDVAGRILCAVRTDPGWTPLFPQARGLLVERGSALSHSAVVARELGIPCIVGLPGLMSRVQTGSRVRLDGGAGTVDVLTADAPVLDDLLERTDASP